MPETARAGMSRGCRSEGIQRNLQVADAIALFRRQAAGAKVALNGRQKQLWHGELRVAALAHGHEFVAADGIADVDIVRALLGDRGFPVLLKIIS